MHCFVDTLKKETSLDFFKTFPFFHFMLTTKMHFGNQMKSVGVS